MRIAIAIVAILMLYAIVGHFDYEDEILQENQYCEMVRSGHWPAYKPEIRCQP